MVKKLQSSALLVYMNSQRVGSLTKQSSGQLAFHYDLSWLENKNARPISLSLPLREQIYSGDLVYNFFDNLLPDNESIRVRIQKRFKAQSNHCFDLLSYIGADCVGALQLLTEPLKKNLKEKIVSTPVNAHQIAKILKNYRQAPLGMQEDSDFRISIAGAQEKSAFLKRDNQWHIPNESTPTTHIFKLPIGKIKHSGIDLSESVENEWLCLQILAAYQLPVCQSQMIEFEDLKVLVCERFDRIWNTEKNKIYRLPQEDMCQVFGTPSALKYESDGGPGMKAIMNFLNGSYEPLSDRNHFFKACFIFWVLGAIDGHAKNFSIYIKSQGRFQLTPLYDVLSAYPMVDKRQLEWNKMKMAMSVQGKNKHYHWNKILLRHWYEMADHCKLPKQACQNIIEEVFDNMDQVIEQVILHMPKNFPLKMAESIFNGMKKVKK